MKKPNIDDQETIIGACIEHNGETYIGYRHHTIGLMMVGTGICKRPYPGGRHQRFVTSFGRFVSREEALEIAIRAQQVQRSSLRKFQTQLFSEDIWDINGNPKLKKQ